jgi:hypothetical protein
VAFRAKNSDCRFLATFCFSLFLEAVNRNANKSEFFLCEENKCSFE